MIQFVRCGKVAGKNAYRVMKKEGEGSTYLGVIEFFNKKRIVEAKMNDEPHWAFRHASGRIDRFALLSEAKDEAMKC